MPRLSFQNYNLNPSKGGFIKQGKQTCCNLVWKIIESDNFRKGLCLSGATKAQIKTSDSKIAAIIWPAFYVLDACKNQRLETCTIKPCVVARRKSPPDWRTQLLCALPPSQPVPPRRLLTKSGCRTGIENELNIRLLCSFVPSSPRWESSYCDVGLVTGQNFLQRLCLVLSTTLGWATQKWGCW